MTDHQFHIPGAILDCKECKAFRAKDRAPKRESKDALYRESLRIRHLLLLVLLTFAMIGGTVSALPVHPSPLGFTTGCTTPTALTATPSSILSNVQAHIRFRCGTAEAFMVDAGTTATPVFLLPSGGVSLWVVPHAADDKPLCADDVGSVRLATGTLVMFSTSGTWDYCMMVTAPTASFPIVWSSVLLLQTFPAIGACSPSGATVGSTFLLGLFVAIFGGIFAVFVFLTKGDSGDIKDHLGSPDFVAFVLIVVIVAVLAAFMMPPLIAALNRSC